MSDASVMAAMKEGLEGWLQRVRTTEEYSDVLVRVNGHDFRLHMLPLMNASAFFRNLPNASDAAHVPKLVTIHDLPGTSTLAVFLGSTCCM